MHDVLTIGSHKGPYSAVFCDIDFLNNCISNLQVTPHFLVDKNVGILYAAELSQVLEHSNTIYIDANENSKSIEQVVSVIEVLIANQIRRDHMLIAVGGGIIQDITCFISSTLLRGVPWQFVPTTLLSQADSCIGSKSSINLKTTKNILGTFNPPQKIYVCSEFLCSLDKRDKLSGIGEILKVYAISGASDFEELSKEYDKLLANSSLLLKYIRGALKIKQKYIEADEFDSGIRNIFNYGHSFGHAIEAATCFDIPHGIAVSMGMDMANYVSMRYGMLSQAHFDRMHKTLSSNYSSCFNVPVNFSLFIEALKKDKKNTSTKLVLIFALGADAKIEKVEIDGDEYFFKSCYNFFKNYQHEPS